MIKSNMRCIETIAAPEELSDLIRIKSNMRCIETPQKQMRQTVSSVIKSNMRCIETPCTVFLFLHLT